ncbi:MAG: hypothetical protein R3274_05085 [Desulfobacterales bacterium]|nr:hypothetical protein [Desulfobacterales bacterium]
MTVWVPILLLLILVEIWWFGAHCMAYLSDIKELFQKMAPAIPGASDPDEFDSKEP